MKKNYLFLLLCLLSITGYAQENGMIKFSTSHPLGTEVSFFPTTVSSDNKVKVDWGDGEIKEYTLSTWNKKVSGNKTGDTIKVHTQLKAFDCSDKQLTSLVITNQPGLLNLQCYNNELAVDLLDISGALNLTNLDCHNNKLLLLNLTEHTKLENLDCYCYEEEEGTLTTILLPQSGAALKNISAYGNDISALDISGCLELTNINMEQNALMTIDVTKLENLRSLNVSNNIISELDVTKNSKLEKLFCGKNQLKKLDIYANKELIEISCSENKLSELDLSGNKSITKIYCSDNQIKSLNLTGIARLTQLQCGFNQLRELDLSKNTYLQKIWCQSNQLDFIDFYYNQNISYIDCRNNAGMTPCALNYMYGTLSGLESSSTYANLLVEGCNAETSDTGIATALRWQTDVKGDATATCEEIDVNIVAPQNGTFTLWQPEMSRHDSIAISNNKVKAGVPVYVKAVAADNYKVKSILVNDKAIQGSTFVTSEQVTVAVNFAPVASSNYTTLGTAEGTSLSLGVSGAEPETEIEVDWGNGVIETLFINNTNISRIEGVSKGTTVRINGLLDYLDCSENDLTALDVSHNLVLRTLDCYWTGITALEVSKNTELGKLNCSYNSLSGLDVSGNAKLFSLSCYNCELDELNVSQNTLLEELTVKNNNLTAIDLSANTKLVALDVQNNSLATIALAGLTELQSLACSGNGMTGLDVTFNTKLTNLVCANNQLTTIDLSKNTLLERLFCQENLINTLDLSKNQALNYIECSGNGMSACELNDFYQNLPLCPIDPDKFNIYNRGTSNSNDAERSETAIAARKGWRVSAQGDGSGCDEAYVTFAQPEHGTIALVDSREQEIVSGTKVAKNSVLEVKATPDAGYELDYVKANQVKVVDNKFTIVMATEVEAKFKLNVGIDETHAGISLYTGENSVSIVADDASAQIYTIAGATVYKGTIQGEKTINLPSGSYIIKVVTAQKQLSQVVSVY